MTKDNKNSTLLCQPCPVCVSAPGCQARIHAVAPYGYDLVVYDGVSPGSSLNAETVVINAPLGMSQSAGADEYEYARMVHRQVPSSDAICR